MIRWRHDQQNWTVDFDTGEMQLSDEQRRPLERAAAMVRRRSSDLPAASLQVRLRRSDHGDGYEVEMTLETMERSLRALGQSNDLQPAVEFARDKIVSQLGPFKASLRREQTYRLRSAENTAEPIGAMASPAAPSRDNPELRKFEEHMQGYWRPLVRQVNREIAALEMNNLLPLGELAPQDIVDEVIVRTFEQFRIRPPDVPLEIWLYQQARQVLAERRQQIQQETPMSSIPPARRMTYAEPPPPPNPLTEPAEVLMDLLEPEPEPLPGEDIAEPVEPSDPALAMRRAEMQHALRKIINHMPAVWREAIWLHYLDGFDAREIAAIQDRDEKEVRNDLHQAVSRLRDAMHGWRDWPAEHRDEASLRQQTEPPSRSE